MLKRLRAFSLNRARNLLIVADEVFLRIGHEPAQDLATLPEGKVARRATLKPEVADLALEQQRRERSALRRGNPVAIGCGF